MYFIIAFLLTVFSFTSLFKFHNIAEVQNAPPLIQAPVHSQGPPPTPVVQQIIVAPSFGREPVRMKCPHCQEQIQTSIKSKPGSLGKCRYKIMLNLRHYE